MTNSMQYKAASHYASKLGNSHGIPLIVGGLAGLYFWSTGAVAGAIGSGLLTFGHIQEQRKKAEAIKVALVAGTPIPHLPPHIEAMARLPEPSAPTQQQAQATHTTVEITNNPTTTIEFNPQFNPSISVGGDRPATPSPVAAPSRWDSEDGGILEPLDAAKLMAQCGDHVLISCRTGSGKTTLVGQAIARAYAEQSAEFWIVDPKGSRYCGLEKGANYCAVPLRQDGSAKVLRVLGAALDELQQRITLRAQDSSVEFQPLIVLLDEWPTLLSRCESGSAQIIKDAETILRTGREDRVFIWIVGQSHYSQDCGFNRNTQGNFTIFALGRGEAWQSLELAVSDSHMIRMKQDRDRLQALLLSAREQGSDAPVCFTNMGGGKLGQLPYCPKEAIPQILDVPTAHPEPDDGNPDPREVLAGALSPFRTDRVLRAIQGQPKSFMPTVMNCSKGGSNNPKWEAAITLWEMVNGPDSKGWEDAAQRIALNRTVTVTGESEFE